MAKIKLTDGGFTLIPEGVTTFKIVGATYEEDFGKLEVELQTKNGQKHVERFSLVTDDGEVNEGATKAFSYFAKTALNNYNIDEIDVLLSESQFKTRPLNMRRIRVPKERAKARRRPPSV